MHFEFATAGRIIFGQGKVGEVGLLAVQMGKHALVITGSHVERAAGLIQVLEDKGMRVTTFQVRGEPDTGIVAEGSRLARLRRCDVVIGMGGGSVIDAGKAIAALVTNHGDIFDFLEVVGKAQTITRPPLPYIAIPTTAGTGAEVTKNAVLVSKEHGVKVSMRSYMLLPRIVVVDPELTYSMPPHVTANTGLDALTQLIEAYVSLNANPITDGMCREGIMRSARSLEIAYRDGNNAAAREDMAIASLLSGMALANAKLGAVHGFAAPLGGMFNAPHGAICARLLPIVMETNVQALKTREIGSRALKRYDEIAQMITGDGKAKAEKGVEWVRDLCKRLDVEPLSGLGLSRSDIPEIVERAKRASSMKGNPVELTDKELTGILERAL
ncbi:MAG: alcohol dehydrogenase [Deltaproteobacteria bacterium]|nr:MAG: alcohol dehydrogenase [Deltaproteobacteria bacterium]